MNSNSRSALGQHALPRDYLVSDSIYQLETERVFSGHWLYVCHENEIGESGCLRVCARESNLIIVRGDGGLRAFHNFCRHRGSELVTEKNCDSIGGRIQCPYHAWTYDRNGELVAAPNMTDQDGFDKTEFGLMQVDCETWHGFVFVRFRNQNMGSEGNDSNSLSEFLSPLELQANDWSFARLKIAKSIVYEVEANWKLLFQNYNECYHCPTVHPALNQLTPYKGATNDLDEGPILGGPMSLSNESESMTSDGKAVGQILPRLNEDQKRAVLYYTIFPSFFLSAHPDYVLIHRIERVGAKKSKVVCQFLFHDESTSQAGFDPTPAIEFWDLTNKQDWNVCELAQKGVSDIAYQPGPYADLESIVAAFDRHYRSVID